ncbi:MAG: neutral/alkaline non-lysosomal ceramidase N-terminal domain-containing protein, partial [Alphaproteobacteria bacterium]|nr:neutral/alkaline non-lysosomal ceramidase N-terminal domain-containing protein [Alphaproteobacteria bacterium]
SLVVCAVPSEPTTVAGRRLRETMRAAAPEGVRHVVVSPYANAYAGYLTTAEEYQVQHYEAAYTVFGPHSVAALRTVVEGLMGRLGAEPQVGELPARVPREALLAMPFEAPWGA